MKPTIKESARSEEVRDELRKQDYRVWWTVVEGLARISYWTNGAGKALLLQESAHDLQWSSWDIYVQLTPENNIAKTYAALHEYSGTVKVGA
jgi:hypothetical protein